MDGNGCIWGERKDEASIDIGGGLLLWDGEEERGEVLASSIVVSGCSCRPLGGDWYCLSSILLLYPLSVTASQSRQDNYLFTQDFNAVFVEQLKFHIICTNSALSVFAVREALKQKHTHFNEKRF